MAKPTFSIEWDAHEYEHKERSADWFWSMGIITVSVAIASIIFGNAIFGLFIIISAFSLSLFINRPPADLHIIINEKGIIKDRTMYPYNTLHSYCIDEFHPHKKILLRSQKTLMPIIIVPLGNAEPERVDKILSKFLPTEQHDLPFVEKVLEYLGF